MGDHQSSKTPIVPVEEADMRFPPPFFSSQQNPFAPQSQFRLTVNVEGNRGMFAPIHPPTMPCFPPPQQNPNAPHTQLYNPSPYPNPFNQQPSPVMFDPTNHPYQPSMFNPSSQTSMMYNPSTQTSMMYNPSSQTGMMYNPSSQTSMMYNPSSQTPMMYNPSSQTPMMYNPSSQTSLMYNPYTNPIPPSNQTPIIHNQPMLALPPPTRGRSSTTTVTEINSDNEADSEVAEEPRAAPVSKAPPKVTKDVNDSTGKRPFTRSAARCDENVKVKVVKSKTVPNPKQCKPKDAEELHANQSIKKRKTAAKEAEEETEEEEISETGEEEEDNDILEAYRNDDLGRWMDGEESFERDEGDSDFEDTPRAPVPSKDCPKSKAKKSLSLQKGSEAFRAQAASLQKWLDEEDDLPSTSKGKAGKKTQKPPVKKPKEAPSFQSEPDEVVIINDSDDSEEDKMIPNAEDSDPFELTENDLKERDVVPGSCYICYEKLVPLDYLGIVNLFVGKCEHSPRSHFHCEVWNVELYRKCGWCRKPGFKVSSVLYSEYMQPF